MDEITLNTKAMIKAAIDARLPTVLVGPPGTGKTAAIKALAKEIDYEVISLVGSRMDPTDVVGLPKGELLGNDDEGKPIYGTVNLSPWWQVEILQKRKVILFLDEWGNSSGAVQAAFLTLLQDREFANGHPFPPETIVIGASNPPEEGADSFEMALPTANRIFWISWTPTAESWYDGMLSGWGKGKPEGDHGKWIRKIVSFIKENPSYLHKIPDELGSSEAYGISSTSYSDQAVLRNAWPSRRSWDNLARVLSHAPDNVYIQDRISTGVVGAAATQAFRDWLRKNDTIDPLEVLDDPSSIDWHELDLDTATLLLRTVVELVSEETSEKVIALFGHIADVGRASLAAPYMRDMIFALSKKEISAEQIERNLDLAKAILPKYKEVTKHTK